jgi:adenosylhomocysteinase
MRTVLARDHFDRLKDGAILSNAGSVHGEIDVETLGKMAASRRDVKEYVEEFKMKDGRRVHLLACGRQINKVAGDGHPASVLDIVFAVEALSIEHLRANAPTLQPKVYPVPETLNRQVSRTKLEVMGVTIDKLTVGQEEYLAGSSDAY